MSLLGYHVPLLRGLAAELKCAPVGEMAQRPGVTDVYRVTVHYYDRRACDSVATLVKTITGGVTLDVVYRRALAQKPLTYKIAEERYQKLVLAFKAAGFDKLVDQSGLPAHDSTDVWMVERAAGSFVRGIIVAPDVPAPAPYQAVIAAVRHALPEAMRMVV
ncbi:MAG: hypothetical protein IAE80_00795 [Anaerolinea sp.]|nr:hypothetical protein [Anaerolinea sp.]